MQRRSHRHRHRGAFTVGTVLAAAGALALSAIPATAAPAPSTFSAGADHAAPGGALSAITHDLLPGHYLVTLRSKPVATYEGGVAGIPATRPRSGAKVDVTSTNARALGRVLVAQQTATAQAVGATATQHYTVALNGFAAELSTRQATELTQRSDVLSVVPDRLLHPTDDRNSQDFLKLSGANGVWSQLGGTAAAGKGAVIGVIDTGVWPESASFAAPALGTKPPKPATPYAAYRQGTTTYQRKADGDTFTGQCQTGARFTVSNCNQKLISARYFGDTFLSSVGGASGLADYVSPRDGEGHGTHTASTAAGNAGVDAVVQGHDYGLISGVAPGASLAVYKALWTAKDGSGGGYESDIIAAIDQAVTDGVDVINYSVGSSLGESAVDDPIALAFLSAASAGIFVAASAGNAGPDAGSADNTAPWVTTVAASTLAPYNGSVTLGNGQKFTGGSASVFAELGPAPLITSSAAALASADPGEAALCYPDTLDPAKAGGKIVICDRGVVARVAKSVEVARAGGVGMVLTNTTDLETDADITSVPTVHLNLPEATKVKAYAAKAGATATLLPGNTTGLKTPYPQVAAFSSRGPSAATGGDILKPDIAAPGVSILAAIAPASNNGHDFEFESGTSMAAPHIAGLAALLKAKYPTLTPMETKSALMTSAGNTVNPDGSTNTDPYSDGAGEVAPDRMLDPGLVYDSGDDDWLAYLESRGVDTGTGVTAVPAWNYNSPSFASAKIVGTRTFTRKVTALTPGIYRATASVPGMTVKVTPSILSFVNTGDTRTYTVTMTQTTQPSGVLTTGQLTWAGAGTTVRSPIAVTPVNVDAPVNVSGTGAKGSVSFPVQSGATDLDAEAFGLTAGTPHHDTLVNDGSSKLYPFTVSDSTLGVQTTLVADDPDVEMFGFLITDPDGPHPVVITYTNSPLHRVDLYATGLAPGKYALLAAGFSYGPSANQPISYRAQTNTVDISNTGGSLKVTPTTIAGPAGTNATIKASWSGAKTAVPATGYIRYGGTTGTFVSIN